MTLPLPANATLLVARLLLAFIFITAGYGKIGGFAGTQQYMAAAGVPGMLLPLVIAVELGLGLLIAVGFQTRASAVILAGFTVLAGVLFHYQPANQMQMIMFTKNLAIAGGFLALAVAGAGAWSVDARLGRGEFLKPVNA